MFTLVKWYMDLVAADGTAFVAYAARVRWRRLALRYASTLLVDPDGTPRERATSARCPPPRRRGSALAWRCDALDAEGTWTPRAPALRRTLAETPAGAIHWACVAPCAEARVRSGSRELVGLGYVERLRLTLPPWRLPFHTLRWGRFLSQEHALVWIDWTGGSSHASPARGSGTRRWVWLDGAEQPGAEVADHGITALDAAGELRIGELRPLRDRRVLASLAATLPGIARVVPRSLRGLGERKWVGRGELVAGGRPIAAGWAIHERATWERAR